MAFSFIGRLGKAISGLFTSKPAPTLEPFRDSDDEIVFGGLWLTVFSSNVERWRYDYDDQDLTVEFKNGSQYIYNGVNERTVRDFIKTDSPGRYVWRRLRGKYSYDKLQSASGTKKPTYVAHVLPV